MDYQNSETTYNPQNFVLNKKKVKRKPIGTYVMLTIYSIYILIPFWILLVTALKTRDEVFRSEFTWWPQQGFSSDGILGVLKMKEIYYGFLNTMMYHTPPTVIGILVSSLASYGFAKMEWKGRNLVFQFLLFTMMIPGSVTLTATFLMYDAINWVNTPLPFLIPGMFGGIGTVFFLRQYMKGIPDDLIGAAKIDGMSEIKIFTTLILPLSAPALLTQGILGFIGHYNEYMGPLLYLQSAEMKQMTMQLVIKIKSSQLQRTGRRDQQMAMCLISMLPMLILYLCLQNYILKGISMSSGLKG